MEFWPRSSPKFLDLCTFLCTSWEKKEEEEEEGKEEGESTKNKIVVVVVAT